ncbi:MAG: MipA/OmpV family protein [Geminicoccaceae bacterium]
MGKNEVWLLAMIFSLGAAAPAMADDQRLGPISSAITGDQDETSSFWNDFDIELGAQLSYEPDYQGSDDYELDILPVLQVTYKDWLYAEFLAAGAFWNLPHGFRMQTGIGFEPGRDSDDNDDLDGLDDIDDTAVLDFGLFYGIGDLTLGFALEQDLLGQGKGLVTFLGARYDFDFLDGRLEIAPQVDISFATAKHLRTEFGISQGESTDSGLDAYRPGAGLKSYGFGTNVDFRLAEHWALVGEAGIEFYGPEATDSPLLDDVGADYGAEVEVGLVYRF